jgi:hypothetical protein
MWNSVTEIEVFAVAGARQSEHVYVGSIQAAIDEVSALTPDADSCHAMNLSPPSRRGPVSQGQEFWFWAGAWSAWPTNPAPAVRCARWLFVAAQIDRGRMAVPP